MSRQWNTHVLPLFCSAVIALSGGAAIAQQPKGAAPPEKQENDAKTKDNSALASAAALGDVPTMLALIKKEADPNWINPAPFSKTALTGAVLGGRLHAVKALVENGADVNLPDVSGRYPVYFAFFSNRDKDKAVEMLQFLLTKGADKGLKREPGKILVALCNHGMDHHDMIGLLVAAGADPNVRCKAAKAANHETTPLIMAIQHSKPEQRLALCKALIASKADVNFKDGKGVSPLQSAKKTEDKEVIVLLEQAGAKE